MFAFITALPTRPGSASALRGTPVICRTRPAAVRRPTVRTQMMQADNDQPQFNVEDFRGAKRPGFSRYAERMNGRAAMIGFVSALVIEAVSGKGLIEQLRIFFPDL